LYEDAKEAVVETGKAVASFIQKRLGIGYSRAEKLIDTLEKEGVVSPANGDTPRKVLVKSE
jgi:S-DNA-T family DNA segregation ATPase FtsK/SpoIIIE